jgi:hypothetical protein
MTDRRTLIGAMGLAAGVLSAAAGAAELSSDRPVGAKDFDFLIGDWKVSHSRLKRRLANDDTWAPFAGTCSMRPLLGGMANVDDNVLDLPEGRYRGIGLRYFNADGRWRIHWVDSRSPGIDPGVVGGFADGVGTFIGDDSHEGRPVRARYIWSQITPISAHWEQAFSVDGEKTWETNWRMAFTRVRA